MSAVHFLACFAVLAWTVSVNKRQEEDVKITCMFLSCFRYYNRIREFRVSQQEIVHIKIAIKLACSFWLRRCTKIFLLPFLKLKWHSSVLSNIWDIQNDFVFTLSNFMSCKKKYEKWRKLSEFFFTVFNCMDQFCMSSQSLTVTWKCVHELWLSDKGLFKPE